MCLKTTVRIAGGLTAAAWLLGFVSPAQSISASGGPLEWRRAGNSALDFGLASVATGPIARVWYASDGSHVYVLTKSGRALETEDLEHWQRSEAIPPPRASSPAHFYPEKGLVVKEGPGQLARIYAAGQQVYRSDDGGYNWTNLTLYRNQSILGGAMTDLAVSPTNPDEILAAGQYGVWRSLDAGKSWAGLNDQLPNLPVRQLLSVPDGTHPLQIELNSGPVVDWIAGEKTGWKLDSAPTPEQTRTALTSRLGASIQSFAIQSDWQYAGSSDGRLFVSSDRGQNFVPLPALPSMGAITRIVADAKDPQFALAIVSKDQKWRILKTQNAGRLWDDITSDLTGPVNGVAADRASGAVYAATGQGIYVQDPDPSGAPGAWRSVRQGNFTDVMLDSEGNQLYAASEGEGVLAALAPHRYRDPRVVSSGDLIARAAAPGALVTLLGSRIQSARAGNWNAPVLAASESQSQIQIPFEASGSNLTLSFERNSKTFQLGVPLQTVSPALFIDRDGSPLIMNADTGLLLDASAPAKANSRLQILATGLGRVVPDWPTGIPAPLDNPPHIAAQVQVFLDRQPLDLRRSILAPGYVGFYLLEVQIPNAVNNGSAELYIEVNGKQSNRVRVFVEQ